MLWVLPAALLASVSVSVYPLVSASPATVRASVHIERDPRNREACLDLSDEDGEVSVSCWPLEGEAAPTVFRREWRDLPSGSYITRVSVAQGLRVLVSRPATFEVR